MSRRSDIQKFKLVPIPAFDARRGYTRCALPGMAVSYPTGPRANVHFWKDKAGRLAVRFSSQGYTFHFEGLLASREHIPEAKMEAFGRYVADVLLEWLDEGVDDLPNCVG